MALAGHPVVISVSTDDITYNEIDGLNDFSLDVGNDTLDTTDFKDTSGAHTRILGLSDISLSLSGDYEHSDTNGQVVLRSAVINKTAVYVKILFDGTNGYKATFYVEKMNPTAGVDGKVEVSFDLVGASTITAVP